MLHNIKKSFRLKLILCFLLCAVIPILYLGISSYITSLNIARRKILESTDLSSRQAAKSIDERMIQVENLADSVHFSLYTLYHTPQEPLSVYMDAFSSTKNTITSLMNAFDIYHISIFLDDNSIGGNEGVNFFPINKLVDYDINKNELRNLGVSPKWTFRKNLPFPYVVSKGKDQGGFLTCYRSFSITGKLLDSPTMEYAFGIHLTSFELSDYLSALYASNTVKAYLVDKNGVVIADMDYEQIGNTLPKEQIQAYLSHTKEKAFHWNGDEILIHPIHSGEWYLITEIPDSYIRQNTDRLVQTTLFSLIIIVFLTVSAILYISKGLTRKIGLLSSAMEQTQWNHKETDVSAMASLLPKYPETSDEIDRLSISCNHMLKALDNSFHEVLELSVKEERLNYQLLQSQINPHFLYNILASIQTLLSLGELKKADQMLSDLSHFYRGLLHKPDEMITIREELDIAELYLRMEALCKNYVFDWSIQLDEGIENFLICKFTLQPVLENSIRHGLKKGGQTMHINIDISYDEDMVRILIEDNGIGIAPDKLLEIQKDLAEKSVRYDRHFGISNINVRINSSLQEHGTITIDSTPDLGTAIYILIPQILSEE